MGIKEDIISLGNKEKALNSARFFKTGKGQYGEGDVFLGLTVPEQRKIALKYVDVPLSEVEELLHSDFHEFRLTGFLILVHKFQSEPSKKIVDFYLKHRLRSNNWDLVDLSADKILGRYLLDKDKKILYSLAKSSNLWERRIAIVSTFEFIRNNKFDDTLKISEMLLSDKHDLIHKAVGWMLREVGKRDQKVLEKFLIAHKGMPRTTLRYAIERFDTDKKKRFMKL